MASMIRTLFIPAFAALALAFAPSANGAFIVSTSIVSVNGQMYNDTPGGAGAVFTTGGTTITFGDTTSTANAVGYPSESVALSGTFSSASASMISVVETITVSNNGVTGTFTETTNYTLTADGLGRIAGGVTVVPTTLIIGGSVFTVTNPQATSTPYGRTAEISAQINISAVPEPASAAMLSLGLIGSIGVVARRRLARA